MPKIVFRQLIAILAFACSMEDYLKDSDSELEDAADDSKSKKKKKAPKSNKPGKAWLKEGGDEEVVDFLDRSAAQKIMGMVLHTFICFPQFSSFHDDS